MVEFSDSRWYAFCDKHKERIEGKKIKGRFDQIEVPEKCEWKRELMQDKRAHKCKEMADWEFYVVI